MFSYFSFKDFKHKFLVFCSVCILASFVGIFTGLFTALCGHVLLEITSLRSNNLEYFLPFMPVVALWLIWVKSNFMPRNVLGDVFQICRLNRKIKHISFLYLPFIMIGTWSCHLVGASVGREGVAMQIGASISDVFTERVESLYSSTDFLRLRKILLICGFASGFSGLFHVPFAAIVFSFELLIVSSLFFYAIIPTILASFISFVISTLVHLPKFEVNFLNFIFPTFSFTLMFNLMLFGFLFGGIGFLFSYLLKNLRFILDKILPNILVRIFVFSLFIAPALFFVYNGRYTGLGTNFINGVFFENTNIYWFDWILKLFFTILCLGAGFFGGEVTPLFAIGVCSGYWFAPFFGLEPVLGAALGFVAVFASATNTLFGPIIIAWEIFGFNVFILSIFVVFFSFLSNFDYSIYSSLMDSHGLKNRLFTFTKSFLGKT